VSTADANQLRSPKPNQTPGGADAPRGDSFSGTHPWLRFGDFALAWATRGAAVLLLVLLASVVVVLFKGALPAIEHFGAKFLVTSEWRVNEVERPLRDAVGKIQFDADGEQIIETIPQAFGALPTMYGTAVSSSLALLFAVPLALGSALFLVRLAPKFKLAAPIGFLIEFLASIPSIAYGVWGLFVLAPFLQSHIGPFVRDLLLDVPGLRWMFFETVTIAGQTSEREIPMVGRSMLCAGLVLAIMILPIITSVSRDVLRSVPRTQVEGSLALGATWWQSSWMMLKYARSGLFGAVMLGLARAAGETMAVAMVIGNANAINPSPFSPGQTMASLLANEFNDPGEKLHRPSLMYVALILLVMSLTFNIVARWLVVGKKQ
jgi:phosphate transport system permease protein